MVVAPGGKSEGTHSLHRSRTYSKLTYRSSFHVIPWMFSSVESATSKNTNTDDRSELSKKSEWMCSKSGAKLLDD